MSNDKVKAVAAALQAKFPVVKYPTSREWRAIAEAALTASGLLDENAALRAERDALLQVPLDLAKMDSIDDDTDTAAKMVAYYWHAKASGLLDRVRLYEEALERIAAGTKGFYNMTLADCKATARSALNKD